MSLKTSRRKRWWLGGLMLTWRTQKKNTVFVLIVLFFVFVFSNPGNNSMRNQFEFRRTSPPAVPTSLTDMFLHTASDLAQLPQQLPFMYCMWQDRLAWGGREVPQSRRLSQLQLADLRDLCGRLKACLSDGCSRCAGRADAAATLRRECCHLGGDWWWESAEPLLDSPAAAPLRPPPLFQRDLEKNREKETLVRSQEMCQLSTCLCTRVYEHEYYLQKQAQQPWKAPSRLAPDP